jgi:hypothetical protein
VKKAKRTSKQDQDEPLTEQEESEVRKMLEHFQAKKLLRKELGNGDDSHWRTWMELFERTGIPVHVILKMPSSEVDQMLCAAIRKKRNEMQQSNDPGEWILVAGSHCKQDRSTLHRHAKKFPDRIRKADGRRGYLIHRNYLSEYVAVNHLKHYTA